MNRRALAKFLSLGAIAALLAGAPAVAAGPTKIVLLINGTQGDKSFFDSAARGIQLIHDKYGDKVQTKVIEMSYDQSKWRPTLEDVSGQNWDLIITGTYQMTDMLAEIAPENPTKRYIHYDGVVPYENGANKNVYSVTFKENEPSYLAGMLAEGIVKSGTLPKDAGTALGFLGGLDIPVINNFLMGYVEGAQAVDPGAKVAVSYIGSFSDAAKGKELALAQYRNGTAIGFNVAGQAGLGQLSAAKDVGRYAIGVDSDQGAIFRATDKAIADRVVTSVLKNIDVTLLRSVDLMMQGKLGFGTAEALGLAEGGVGIVEDDVYMKAASPELREKIKQAAADIASGKIKVTSAYGLDTKVVVALRDKVRP